ncbi:peptidylprolyl isomerase [Colwelliaceae bacterium 6471]
MHPLNIKQSIIYLVFAATALFQSPLHATIVEFQTSLGNFQVNLFDEATPKTVDNFLSYVNDGNYVETVIHRNVPNFVTQGGGFKFEGDINLSPIVTRPSIENEPVYSNKQGTIAMAKLANNANSATSQWFINLADNSSNLDVQNGGFTVFGQVIGDGMAVVNTISTFTLCNEIPMPDYSAQDCSSGLVPGAENFVTIHQVTIVDSSTTTASDLNPVENTLIDQVITPPTKESGSGGGSISWFSLLFIALLSCARKK